jgi:hypothetical protein
MDALGSGVTAALEWAASGRPMPGQAESGDLFVVAPFAGGALAAAIDGLGHGAGAAAAARAAARELAAAAGAPAAALIRRCHEALRGTRGAVLSLASFDTTAGEMTWAGVGNVQGLLLRFALAARPACEALLPRSGVVGGKLSPLGPRTLAVAAGDLLVMTTDGIRDGFAARLPVAAPVAEIAELICRGYAAPNDDALVLVARYRGG